MKNLEIREFEKAVIDFTNKSALPVEVKRLCFKDILSQLDCAAEKEIVREIQERNKAEKEAQDE